MLVGWRALVGAGTLLASLAVTPPSVAQAQPVPHRAGFEVDPTPLAAKPEDPVAAPPGPAQARVAASASGSASPGFASDGQVDGGGPPPQGAATGGAPGQELPAAPVPDVLGQPSPVVPVVEPVPMPMQTQWGAYAQPTGPNLADPRLVRADEERRGFIPRLFVSPLVAYAVGVSLAFVGGLVGFIAACRDGESFDAAGYGAGCFTGIAVGAAVGFSLGVPLGVHWSGSWFSGLGQFGLTLLGTLAGVSLSLVIAYASRSLGGISVSGLLAVAGGMAGYEVSSSAASRQLRVEAGFPAARVGVAPVFADGRVTGGTLSLAVGL
jgi:hypothetical protein